MSVFIIAEAGVNHNGSLEICKKLIDVSVRAGADAVKFQTFKAGKLVTTNAGKARYQIENTGTRESQIEMLRKLELSPNVHKGLFAYCRQRNISFLSTPFDEESADMLDDLGMEIFKIPSGEITNKPLIQHIASKKKPIILSTGMSYLGEVENAVSWIDEIWNTMDKKPQLSVLHCVSSYPARIEDVNLRAIKTMKMAFGLPVGYSDHTMGTEITMAAVAMGAKIIEKHFTLSRGDKGPDSEFSLEPHELKQLCIDTKIAWQSLGKAGYERKQAEKGSAKYRRSIYAIKDIKKGELFTEENIRSVRPGYGMHPKYLGDVLGKKALDNYKYGTKTNIKMIGEIE